MSRRTASRRRNILVAISTQLYFSTPASLTRIPNRIMGMSLSGSDPEQTGQQLLRRPEFASVAWGRCCTRRRLSGGNAPQCCSCLSTIVLQRGCQNERRVRGVSGIQGRQMSDGVRKANSPVFTFYLCYRNRSLYCKIIIV